MKVNLPISRQEARVCRSHTVVNLTLLALLETREGPFSSLEGGTILDVVDQFPACLPRESSANTWPGGEAGEKAMITSLFGGLWFNRMAGLCILGDDSKYRAAVSLWAFETGRICHSCPLHAIPLEQGVFEIWDRPRLELCFKKARHINHTKQIFFGWKDHPKEL